MPDALSKTVPIWTCVLNRIFFPERPESHQVTTPPTVVGASEHAQIAARIASFVDSLKVGKVISWSYTDAKLLSSRHSI